MKKYIEDLILRFRDYQKIHFPDVKTNFDLPYEIKSRPPVFAKLMADYNVIRKPIATPEETMKLSMLLPRPP